MAASSLGSANDQSASPAHYIRFHYLMVEVGVGWVWMFQGFILFSWPMMH